MYENNFLKYEFFTLIVLFKSGEYMCRGKNESGSRRCPCDTSEKRRLRRVNRKTMDQVEKC